MGNSPPADSASRARDPSRFRFGIRTPGSSRVPSGPACGPRRLKATDPSIAGAAQTRLRRPPSWTARKGGCRCTREPRRRHRPDHRSKSSANAHSSFRHSWSEPPRWEPRRRVRRESPEPGPETRPTQQRGLRRHRGRQHRGHTRPGRHLDRRRWGAGRGVRPSGTTRLTARRSTQSSRASRRAPAHRTGSGRMRTPDSAGGRPSS